MADSSVDFWKTMRIWSEYVNNNTIDIDGTLLSLLTTESISSSSILFKLKNDFNSEQDIKEIITKLDGIATLSENNALKKAFEEYLKLSYEKREKLIQKIRIYDSNIDIDTINEKLKKHIAWQVEPNKVESFLEKLEGWWFKKCIENLQGQNEGISFLELRQKLYSIRDTFSYDNLPNDFDKPIDISEDDLENTKERRFIKQLELIALKTNSRAVKAAISDFRRAFEQRSKWIRDTLLNPEEEEIYDRRLYDHWHSIFQILQDEAENKHAPELEKLGYEFYKKQFLESCPQIKIREKFKEDYLTRGSYHMLSENKKIGWHPKYEELL